jgi:hypothetical protein
VRRDCQRSASAFPFHKTPLEIPTANGNPRFSELSRWISQIRHPRTRFQRLNLSDSSSVSPVYRPVESDPDTTASSSAVSSTCAPRPPTPRHQIIPPKPQPIDRYFASPHPVPFLPHKSHPFH